MNGFICYNLNGRTSENPKKKIKKRFSTEQVDVIVSATLGGVIVGLILGFSGATFICLLP